MRQVIAPLTGVRPAPTLCRAPCRTVLGGEHPPPSSSSGAPHGDPVSQPRYLRPRRLGALSGVKRWAGAALGRGRAQPHLKQPLANHARRRKGTQGTLRTPPAQLGPREPALPTPSPPSPQLARVPPTVRGTGKGGLCLPGQTGGPPGAGCVSASPWWPPEGGPGARALPTTGPNQAPAHSCWLSGCAHLGSSRAGRACAGCAQESSKDAWAWGEDGAGTLWEGPQGAGQGETEEPCPYSCRVAETR